FKMSQMTAPRRAIQACSTCRHRKTRCDAKVPKCSLCVDLNVECHYIEPKGPRIDPNTRLLLDRIQHLEDRIFTHVPKSIWQPANTLISGREVQALSPGDLEQPSPTGNSITSPEADTSLLTLPVTHDATANHVYQWPILRAILNEANPEAGGRHDSYEEATDVFLMQTSPQDHPAPISPNHAIPGGLESQIATYEELVNEFFLSVHTFYPVLQQGDILQILRHVIDFEYSHGQTNAVSLSQYCLLILVLCLGAFSNSRRYEELLDTTDLNNSALPNASLEDELCGKATLLSGSVMSSNTIEAVQCLLLSSVYMGARGRVLDSQQHIHAAARKCGIITKRSSLENSEKPYYSDTFRRLFWVIYVYESDFASELSLTPPSGIARFEDLVPYPTSQPASVDLSDSSIDSPMSTSPLEAQQHQDLAAFQISANSAIRRYLNRINAVMYDPKESWRKKNHTAYATWLIKVSSELKDHHEAIHRNLPPFLLRTDTADFPASIGYQHSETDQPRQTSHPWNVVRLKGRYWAGQYVIHRPFVEYVLLNPAQFSSNPLKDEMLEHCKTCIGGCYGFVKVFANEQAICTTNLFATGMAMFTMVIILMIATICPSFQSILPHDIEDVIAAGQRNLRRFSCSVKEFEWHIAELDRLDQARKLPGIGRVFSTRL
ncbi:hypothetical protein N431DRAFT_347452, partial [Stipitochalara longipes BDJ]